MSAAMAISDSVDLVIHGGTIERAAIIAGHRSTRTTQLYDRRSDDVTLDEIEKIRFV